jgi:hypothetical protein
MNSAPAFDLADFELSEGDCHQDSIPVMIPRSPFKTHPDPNRVSKVILSRFDKRHWWLVNKEVARTVPVPRPWVSILHHAVLQDGTNFILPLTLPRDRNGYEDWYNTLKKAIGMARKQWVTVEPDSDSRSYRILADNNSWVKPSWMAGDWQDFVEVGFYDRTITIPEQAEILFQRHSRQPIEEEAGD